MDYNITPVLIKQQLHIKYAIIIHTCTMSPYRFIYRGRHVNNAKKTFTGKRWRKRRQITYQLTSIHSPIIHLPNELTMGGYIRNFLTKDGGMLFRKRFGRRNTNIILGLPICIRTYVQYARKWIGRTFNFGTLFAISPSNWINWHRSSA